MLSYSGTQMMAPSERLGLLDDMETFINEHRVVPENERGSLSLRQPPKLSPDLVNLPPSVPFSSPGGSSAQKCSTSPMNGHHP